MFSCYLENYIDLLFDQHVLYKQTIVSTPFIQNRIHLPQFFHSFLTPKNCCTIFKIYSIILLQGMVIVQHVHILKIAILIRTAQ
jgi:hypothetical protein